MELSWTGMLRFTQRAQYRLMTQTQLCVWVYQLHMLVPSFWNKKWVLRGNAVRGSTVFIGYCSIFVDRWRALQIKEKGKIKK